MGAREAFKLAYRFIRSDGQEGAHGTTEIWNAAMEARSARVWGREDPLYRARTRRTYAIMDIRTEKELNG